MSAIRIVAIAVGVMLVGSVDIMGNAEQIRSATLGLKPTLNSRQLLIDRPFSTAEAAQPTSPAPSSTSKQGTAKPSVRQLLRSLQDPSPKVRREATEIIRTMGSKADPKLVIALTAIVREDHANEVVLGAVRALAETGGQQRTMVVHALQRAFVRTDVDVRCGKCYIEAFSQLQALDALWQCVPELLDAVATNNNLIQDRAIGKLADVGAELPENAISEVTARLKLPKAPHRLWYILVQAAPAHPDFVTRELIALLLQGRGLRSGLGIPDWEPADIARGAGPGALPAIIAARSELVEAIEKGSEGVPYLAAGLLALLGLDSLNELTVLASSSRYETREAAIHAIAEIGELAVPNLIESLSAEEARQNAAVRALAKMHPSGAVVLAATKALADQRSRVREAAARVLGLIGHEATTASPELLAALDSEKNPVVLGSVARALGKIGIGASVPRLVALVRSHPEVVVRSAAAEALGDIRPVAPSTISVLVEALADKAVRSSASSALRQAGLAALPILARAMSHPNSDVRGAAIYDIGEICESDLPASFIHMKQLGGIENIVRAIVTISDTIVPKFANCSDAYCAGAAEDLRHAISRFREVVLSESGNWPALYDELNSQQMDVLDKTVIVTAKAADSISEKVLMGHLAEDRYSGKAIVEEITSIRDEFVALASALITKYRHEALSWKVMHSGISSDTLGTLGLDRN